MDDSLKCSDMLVRLYDLPPVEDDGGDGVVIRRALVPESHLVVDWVGERFSRGWASECQSGFAGHPVRCFIATEGNHILGFVVYDAVARGVVGPIGVDDSARGRGLGKALLVRALHDMRAQGYAYAVIGWVAPKAQLFFQKTVRAEVIHESNPQHGMYKSLLSH